MLENLLTKVIRLLLTLAVIALAIALFFIGIIVLWYALIAGLVIWLVRRLVFAWKGRHPPAPPPPSRPSGRIIEHE